MGGWLAPEAFQAPKMDTTNKMTLVRKCTRANTRARMCTIKQVRTHARAYPIVIHLNRHLCPVGEGCVAIRTPCIRPAACAADAESAIASRANVDIDAKYM